RGITWWLFGLRALGLFFLALMFARPAWTTTDANSDRGQVAIVLDDSRSMGLPDAEGRPRYEAAKDALARVKQNLPAGVGVVLFDIGGNRIADAPKEPEAGFTDLEGALRRAARLRQ